MKSRWGETEVIFEVVFEGAVGMIVCCFGLRSFRGS